MKIYMPQNEEIRRRVVEEVSGEKEFDYTCNANEYILLREFKSC